MSLPEATLKKLYRDKADYAKKVDERLAQLVREGWSLPEYVESVKADARATEIRSRVPSSGVAGFSRPAAQRTALLLVKAIGPAIA